MKKSLTCFLLLLPVLFLQAEVIEKTYRFNEYRIIETAGHQSILFENTVLNGLTGEPALPYCAVQLLLPPGHVATKVEFIGKGMKTIQGTYNLYPMQPSRPLSEGKSGNFKKNEQAYNSTLAYPENQCGNFSTNFMNGYAILLSTFTPVSYIPVTGELYYYEEVTIRVTTEADFKAGKALENVNAGKAIKERVRRFVQNTGNIDAYQFSENKSDSYQILMISPAQFESEFDDLRDLYLVRGYISEFMSVEDISSTMPGQDQQEKIRNYIIQEYQSNNVEYVILGGDEEHVPYRGFYCYVVSGSGYEDDDIPADLYYSALDGTWNDDGDNRWGEIGEDDLLPDIAVARLSFSDTTEFHKMLHKTISYQDNPVLGEMTHPLLAGEHLYSNPLTWGGDYLDLLIGERDDNGYTTTGIPPEDSIYKLYDRDATWSKSDLIARINEGRSFIHHSGHSNAYYTMRLDMDDITNANFYAVNGTDHNYTLVYTHGCICGAFDENDCIAEKMLYIDNFVVAGAFNSRFGWFNEGQTEGPSAHLHREFTDALYHEKIDRIGATHMESKIQTSTWVNAPGQHEEGALRWCFYDCNILGDAAMAVWTAEPYDIQTIYPQSIIIGTDSIEVNVSANGTPIGNYRCTFILDNTCHGIGITDSLGNATIVFDPPVLSPGDGELFISGYNSLLHTYIIPVVPAGTPYIVYFDHEMDEITGNSNGLPDYGEYAYLSITMENVGDVDAENVSVSIHAQDNYFTIEDSTAFYGSIAAGATMFVSDEFTFHVAGNAPDQHMVDISVEANDGNKESWTSDFQMTLLAPVMTIGGMTIKDTIDGNGNGFLDPGETAVIMIHSSNTGHSDASEAIGIFTCDNPEVTVADTLFTIGYFPVDTTVNAIFEISIDESASLGTAISLEYRLVNAAYSDNEIFELMIGLLVEDFESAGFNSFPWVFEGNAPWTICEDDPFEGSYCMKSGAIGNNSSSIISINFDVIAPGEISFYKKVSSEEDFDYLMFSVDGEIVGQWSGEISWSRESYDVSSGNHTLSWIYEKDPYVIGGEDCAWVDYIVFPPHTNSVSVREQDVSIANAIIYPNPAGSQATLEIDIAIPSTVRIDLINSFGQCVKSIENKKLQMEGSHQHNIDLQNIPAGVYLCIIRTETGTSMLKIIHTD